MKSCEEGVNYFLSSIESSVVLNILFSHANTNLPITRFPHEQFVISKYSSIRTIRKHSCMSYTRKQTY